MNFLLRSIIFFCIFCIFSAQASEKVPPAGKRILWINTYAADDPWCRSLMSGFQETMKQAAVNGKYEIFDLGIRYQLAGATAAADLVALAEMLESTPYDLIVTTDTSAADLFLDLKLKKPEKSPVLLIAYAGPAPLKKRIPPGSGLTGIQVSRNLEDSVLLARRLRPDLKDVVVVTEAVFNDQSVPKVDQRIQDSLGVKIRIIGGNEYSTEKMLEEVELLPKDALLLFDSWMSAQETLAEHSYTVLPRIQESFPGLIFGKYDSYMRSGSMGGLVQRGRDIGIQGGHMALRLMAGAPAPAEESKPVVCLDETALTELKIPISSAPKDTIWVNIPPSFWEKHVTQFAALGLILIVSLIVYSIALRSRRRMQLKNEMLFQHFPSRLFVFNRQGMVIHSHLPEQESQSLRSVKDLPEEVSRLFEEVIEQVFRSGKDEVRLYFLNGEHRRTQFIRLPENNPFQQDAVMVISSDVTELHNANPAARRLSDRLRLTLDSIGDAVITTDPEGRVTSLNPIAEKLTGFTSDEAVGRKHEEVFHIIHALDNTPVVSPIAQALASAEIVHLSNHVVLIAKDGARRHVNDSAAPIMEDGSVAGGVLVFRDVTEDYEQRTLLRVQASALYTAMKIAKFNYFRLNPQGRLISASSNTFWPIDENKKPLPATHWADPEFVDPLETQWQALLSGESNHLYQVYSSTRKGEKQYFEVRMEKSFNDITGETELCGVIQDITEARKNEMLYRDSLNLFETVVEHLPGFLFVKDVDDEFRFLLCNTRFEELMGHTGAELIGHRDRDFFVDENGLCKIEEDDKKLVADGNTIDVIESFTNSTGRFFAMRTVKKLLYKSDGKRLLLGMGVDLTREYQLEQKQAETIKMLNEYIASERILYSLLSKITLAESFDDAINEMLRLVGESFDADRCCVFRYSGDQYETSSNTHEWCRAPEYSLIDRMQDVDMRSFANFTGHMLDHQPLALDDLDNPPAIFGNDFKQLQPLAIKSMLGSGIWLDNRLYGFVGMDFYRKKRKFTDCDIHTITGVASLFQLAYDREKQRQLLEDSIYLQKQTVDNITIPLTMVGLDYKLLAANPSALKREGINATWEEVKDTYCYDSICKCGAPPEHCPVRETIATQKPCSKEYEFRGFWQIGTAQPVFDRNGKMLYVLKAEIDIDEQKRQKRELELSMEKVLVADRAKSYFLATVSHELRTPLNAIIGFSELMLHDQLDRSTQEEYLRSVSFSGSTLLNLVNDVLDLSKLEAEQMSLTPAETDISVVIKEVANVFKLKTAEKGLDFRVNLEDLPGTILVDALRLRQVLLNLLGNAFKFTANGFVELSAKFVPAGGGKTGELTLCVSDSGIGISKEQQSNIFDPFIQDTITRGKRIYEGSGLGLAITKRLLDKMDASITLESEPGVGTTFTVRIANVEFVPAQNTNTEMLKIEKLPEPDKKQRVLIVDDVPVNLLVLGAMLRRINVKFVSLDSAAAVLEHLKTDRDFDAILTDIWMPETSGVELAKLLKNDPLTCDIPVMAVTADTQLPAADVACFAGVLSKPITIDSLEKAFKNILRLD